MAAAKKKNSKPKLDLGTLTDEELLKRQRKIEKKQAGLKNNQSGRKLTQRFDAISQEMGRRNPTTTTPTNTTSGTVGTPGGDPINSPGEGSDQVGGGTNTGTPSNGGTATPGGQDPYGMFNQIFQSATQGNTQSFDTAANRLRERLGAESAGFSDQAKSKNLARGGLFGTLNEDLNDVQSNYMNSYAQGLNDLSSDFENKRLQGLGIANNSAGGVMGGVNFNSGLNMQKYLGDLNATTQKELQSGQQKWQGGENAANRTQQNNLAQLAGQNANWQQSMQSLFNIPGLFNTLQDPTGGYTGGTSSTYKRPSTLGFMAKSN